MPTKPLLGEGFRKANPKLRMIANGETDVNKVRSDICSAICVKPGLKVSPQAPAEFMEEMVVSRARSKKGMKVLSRDILASVFIERSTSETKTQYGTKRKVRPKSVVNDERLTTATVSLHELEDILKDPSVTRVELGEPIQAPNPVITNNDANAPRIGDRHVTRSGGRRVLVGIIDVQGFDFAHPDFLANQGSETRFVRIWDQGAHDGRPAPSGYNYGAEIRKEHMDAAISAEPSVGIAAQLLEPQSQTAEGSHATHVASIAAGNRGVCHEAFIAGVLVSLPSEDLDRRLSFYDSTRIAHAVKYLFELAEELEQEYDIDHIPVSINISLGTNGHAHDGSSAVSRWIDSALTTPGRSICVAAGNAGQEAPEEEGDTGFIMGRIHTSGRIAARGLEDDIRWLVVGNTIEDLSENELEIWYSPADRISVSLKSPEGKWYGPYKPGQFVENEQLSDGSFFSIYNELYHAANGANNIAIYLSPSFSETQIKGVQAGEWTVRLHGDEIRDGQYHGWIERDDPRRLGTLGSKDAWRFPSFFSQASNVDRFSISSLACGQNVVAVANMDAKAEKINISSSQGPTRDGRFKPDIAAPGTDIVAANGFTFDDDQRWVAMTGTSMASPFVAGVIGLMLERNPKLTAAQIGGIIQRTARPLPGENFHWNDAAGYGAIDPRNCLKEIEVLANRTEIK